MSAEAKPWLQFFVMTKPSHIQTEMDSIWQASASTLPLVASYCSVRIKKLTLLTGMRLQACCLPVTCISVVNGILLPLESLINIVCLSHIARQCRIAMPLPKALLWHLLGKLRWPLLTNPLSMAVLHCRVWQLCMKLRQCRPCCLLQYWSAKCSLICSQCLLLLLKQLRRKALRQLLL